LRFEYGIVNRFDDFQVLFHRVHLGDAFLQTLPQTGRCNGSLNGLSQASTVSRAEMQTVYTVSHFLGHPADVTANNWPLMTKRLLND
jgi:hypothetical protein